MSKLVLSLVVFLLLFSFVSSVSGSVETPVKTVCLLLGVSDFDVSEVEEYDALFCDFQDNYVGGFNIAIDYDALRVAHPDILVYGYMNPLAATTLRAYWSILDGNEDWFIHRTDNGSRVYDAAWGQWIMNITNVDYQAWFVSWCNMKIDDAAVGVPFDGVLFDNVNVALSNVLSSSVLAVVDADYVSHFYDYYVGFLQNTVSSIGGDVIINSEECLGDLHLYVDEVDGELCERVGHPAFGASYNSAADNVHILEQMDYISGEGKKFFGVGGDVTFSSGSDVNRFCYVMFCCGAFDGAYFGVGAPYSYYNQLYDDLVLHTDLGGSVGDRYASAGWTYVRNFEGGYVAVNLNTYVSEVYVEGVYVPEPSVPFVTVVPTVVGGESVDVVVTGVDGAVVILCLVICIGIFVGVFEGFRGSLSR